jgi:hypothetical protein
MKNYKLEINDVKHRNPVNAGLLSAAHELERATVAKQLADDQYKKALAAFQERYV